MLFRPLDLFQDRLTDCKYADSNAPSKTPSLEEEDAREEIGDLLFRLFRLYSRGNRDEEDCREIIVFKPTFSTRISISRHVENKSRASNAVNGAGPAKEKNRRGRRMGERRERGE